MADDTCEECGAGGEIHVRGMSAGKALCAPCSSAHAEELAIGDINPEVFDDGWWRSCTGCHELDEGHPTGPWSTALRCNLGVGCRECGGIGAVWEQRVEESDRPATVSEETINQAIQDLFDKHKADGTVPGIIAALLDVQAVVLITITHDGRPSVQRAIDRSASSATIATIIDIETSAAVTLGAE